MEENTKDGDLLYKLGIMTMNGIGCEADKNAGAEYLRRGAELRNAHAMCEYGKLLVEGKTVPKDTDQGIAMLDEAADTNENARYYLGKVFLKGEYVYPDPELAIKLFHTCDSPYAGYALGKIYLAEPKDAEEMFELLKIKAIDSYRAYTDKGKLENKVDDLRIAIRDISKELRKNTACTKGEMRELAKSLFDVAVTAFRCQTELLLQESPDENMIETEEQSWTEISM